MATPRISVILACFNQTDHLEPSLCSVLDQQYENLELIVVDGTLEDHTTATLRHYRPQIDLWLRQRCQSLAQTINVGLARATGDIVAVLHAGDLYLPDALSSAAKAMSQGASWVVGACQRINEFDERLTLCEPAAPASLASFLRHDSGMLPVASSFWRRTLTQQLGLMDESLAHGYAYDYWCRMLASGHQPVVVSQVLAAGREYEAAIDARATLTQGREAIQIALRHAHHLSAKQLDQLLENCNHRSSIYALAEADEQGDISRMRLLRTLLRQPQAKPGYRPAA